MCCFHATATSTFYTLSLHDALPISRRPCRRRGGAAAGDGAAGRRALQHRGDRRTPLAHDGGAVRARQSDPVAARDADLLPPVRGGGAGAHAHRARSRRHLPLGEPGVRSVARLPRGMGLLGEQPAVLPVAARGDSGDGGLRGRSRRRASAGRPCVRGRRVPGRPVARGGPEPRRSAGGKWLQNLGGYGTWLPALILVLLAGWSLVTRGSATSFTLTRLLP